MRRASVVGLVGWLALDWALTTAIFSFGLLIVMLFVVNDPLTSVMSVLPPLLSFEGSGSVYLWTTYLTSVWLWFYALSGLLVRVVVSFRSGAVIIRDHLNIEEKPLSTMGFVAGGLMACGWWGICLMSWLRE